jgi:hypothetical protein
VCDVNRCHFRSLGQDVFSRHHWRTTLNEPGAPSIVLDLGQGVAGQMFTNG